MLNVIRSRIITLVILRLNQQNITSRSNLDSVHFPFMQAQKRKLDENQFINMGKNKKNKNKKAENAAAVIPVEENKREQKKSESETEAQASAQAVKEVTSPVTSYLGHLEFDAGFETLAAERKQAEIEKASSIKKKKKTPEKRKKDDAQENVSKPEDKVDPKQAKSSNEKPAAEAQQRKKSKKSDPKKVPKLFNYLLNNGGLEEKRIPTQSDGFVNIDDVLDVYLDYLLEDVCDGLQGNTDFVVRQLTDGKLQVKAAPEGAKKPAEKPSTNDPPQTKAPEDPPPTKAPENDANFGHWESPPSVGKTKEKQENRKKDRRDDKKGDRQRSGSRDRDERGRGSSGRRDGSSGRRDGERQEGARASSGSRDNQRRERSREDSGRKGGASGNDKIQRLRKSLEWLLKRGYREKGLELYYGQLYFGDILKVDQFQMCTYDDLREAGSGEEFKLSRDHADEIIELAKMQRQRSGGRFGNDDWNVKISKNLSFLLRHGAEKVGLKLDSGGFIPVNTILRQQNFRDVTLEQIREIVDTNEKKRFFMDVDPDTGEHRIRANQGHTLEVENLELREIQDPSELADVVHGTYSKTWPIIRKDGLRPMGRQHVHFAQGEPEGGGVISGMRRNCEVAIYLNLAAAMKDGIRFFVSANNVVLSSGNKDGRIPPQYFSKVIQRQPTRRALQMN